MSLRYQIEPIGALVLIQLHKEELLANCELSPPLLLAESKSVPHSHYSSFPPTPTPSPPPTGANANFVIRIENPNHYKLTFSDLTAEVFDYDGNILGTINRPESFEVAKRSSGFMAATGAFRDDLVQVGMVGLNCLNNGGETLMQIKAQAELSSFGGNRRISKTTSERVQCTVRNVAGGGNTPGRWTPVPGAVAPVVPRPRVNNPAAPAAPMAPVAPVQPRPNAGNPAAPFPQPGAGNNPPFPQNGPPFPQNGAPFQPNAPFQGGAPPRQGAPFPPNGNAFPPGGVNQNPNAIGQAIGNGQQPNGNGFGGNGMGGGVRGAP